MGKVTVGLSVSLDGFIAGPNDGPDNGLGDGGEALFKWYDSGDTEFVTPSGTMTFKISAASAKLLRETWPTIGAFVTGRRTFDIAHAWGGKHPLDVPIFVVTHHPPAEWVGKAPFTFVTDGVESAIRQAQQVAGDKNVAVGAASLTQQCLKAGLLDEIHLSIAPVLLREGVQLFKDVDLTQLEIMYVVNTLDVTHIGYRIIK
jgi:dihydrofolate reductase